ncbi:MAG: hypothetical protein K8S00_01315 [Bacteroidales bacterium]|nr:hypothetical protein [Bacteroidales bacterium]
MKTIALTILLSLIMSFNTTSAFVQEMDFELEEEEYIDDIPFKTAAVISTIIVDYDTSESEEDLSANSFETKKNNEVYLASKMEFNLEEEEYVDDIPFNTRKIFNAMVNFDENDMNIIVQDFCLANEEYVDDIPFDTKQIIHDRLIYPEFAKNMSLEGTVRVCCKYDENGFLKVIACNSTNKMLRDYVVSVLEDIRLRYGIVSMEKEYVLKFNFRSI